MKERLRLIIHSRATVSIFIEIYIAFYRSSAGRKNIVCVLDVGALQRLVAECIIYLY